MSRVILEVNKIGWFSRSMPESKDFIIIELLGSTCIVNKKIQRTVKYLFDRLDIYLIVKYEISQI